MGHRSAAKVTLIMAAVVGIPVGIFAYIQASDPLRGYPDQLGTVPNFAYYISSTKRAYTHHDTETALSVLALLGPCAPADCAAINSSLESIHSWAADSLTNKNKDMMAPPPIKFLAMHRDAVPLPAGWDDVPLTDKEDFLRPADLPAHEPAIVIIDSDRQFRGYWTLKDPMMVTKSKRLLAKLTSNQYLLDYVYRQTLMWEKSRGKR